MFHYQISLLFFRFFSLIFASNFLLHFDLVIFASKQNKAKRNSSLFFVFFPFFTYFSLILPSFSLQMFGIEVNHVKSGFFFASKRNEIFASISNFASEAKVRAHPRVDLSWEYINRSQTHMNVEIGAVAEQILFWEYCFEFSL